MNAPKIPPLPDEQIEKARDDAAQAYRHHKGSVRGQQLVPADDPDWHFAHAICAARDQQWQAALQAAVLAEREAIIDLVSFHGGSVEIEAAIRARSQS